MNCDAPLASNGGRKCEVAPKELDTWFGAYAMDGNQFVFVLHSAS